MPDTPANQAEYPQPVAQKPGRGFPLARIGAMFSLACGAVVGLGTCRCAGKGQSDLGLLRKLLDVFRPGDVMLADFRRGTRLGEGDHVVEWSRPPKPRSIDRKAYAALPASLTVRECRVRVGQAAFRTRVLVLATTLLDAKEFAKDDLARLYRAR